MAITKITDLVNPMVMADAISAKLEKKLAVTPFAKIDDSLTGVPGDTVYVPQYAYIGDATDVGEGDAVAGDLDDGADGVAGGSAAAAGEHADLAAASDHAGHGRGIVARSIHDDQAFLGRKKLLRCQDVGVSQPNVVGFIEEPFTLDTGHVQNIQIGHHILHVIHFLVGNAQRLQYIGDDVTGDL